MMGAGIVEVDSALHQPEAEDFGIESNIRLHIPSDRGDVMDSVTA
jgi:hypothetical protein